MTITIWLLDPTHTTATALPAVTEVLIEEFDTEGNYRVDGAAVSHIIPVQFLYRVEKAQ